MSLTDLTAKRSKGNGKIQKLSDGGGLYLYISPEGSKSWRFDYRFMGKRKTLVIGPYPAISLKDARERRDEAKKLVVDNIDPVAAKQEAKLKAQVAQANSFEVVAREWVEKYCGSWSESYKGHIVHRLETFVFPTLGKLPIDTITAPTLLACLRKIEERGAICVLHLTMRECGRIFRYAVATGRAERDVAHDLKGAVTPLRTTNHFASIIDPKAIGKLMCSLEHASGYFEMRCAMRLAPLVFVRAKELASAQWAHFDLEKAEWRIPAEIMKMRTPHIVPLSTQAMDILKELKPYSFQYGYLFPGRPKKGSEVTGIRSISLVYALRRLGYSKEEMTFHGFRSMASTILNEKGYNRDWIERQLAHCERNSTRASYNYAEYLSERRQMVQDYSNHLYDLRDRYRTENED